MLRSMEDALDCFAAVTLVPKHAEDWEMGTLKASDAAKAWTSLINWPVFGGVKLSDYRKSLRQDFNAYCHCRNELCIWNLVFVPKTYDHNTDTRTGTVEPNWSNFVIDKNAHSIDAFETAHLFEFLNIVDHAYSQQLGLDTSRRIGLQSILRELEVLLKQHTEHRCQDVRQPPEVAQLK